MTKKRKAKKAKGEPPELASTGDGMRNGKTGQFVPGHPNIGGRPKRIDVGAAVHRIAADKGVDLDQAAWDLMEKLRKRGEDDDTPAAKLWLDRVGGLEKQEIEMQSTTTVYLPDQARADLREMAKDKDLQAIQRAELVRRTNGTG